MATNHGCQIQLYLSCNALADKDAFSKSDPFVVLYVKGPGGQLRQAGRTEVINNNLNPSFATPIPVQFLFETKQEFVVRVYDYDGEKNDESNESLGMAEFQLSHVMTSRGRTKTLPLGVGGGTITISGVEVGGASGGTAQFFLRGDKLKKMDTFGLSDPFFTVNRILPTKALRELYKSEVVKKSLTPTFRPTPAIKIADLTGANQEEPCIEFQFFDEDLTSNDSMGGFKVSYQDLVRAEQSKTPFILRKAHKPDKVYGEIYVDKMVVVSPPSFASMLQDGWQVSLAVSIDFTGSNGNPRQPSSLHFMDPTSPNQYVRAIMGVGETLMEYDTDKQVPVFGFGASINGRTEHFFHVNQQPNPYVAGVQGILDAYGRFLPTCVLSGPTNFAPTIKSAAQGARATESDKCYTVLLIITDGEITDMDATINEIVNADDAPLSIVIVGVGNGCDFSAMDQLDGDGAFLRSGFRVSRRDIVQFVPFRNFVALGNEALAAEVLREIPRQVEDYAQLKGVKVTNHAIAPQQQQPVQPPVV